MIKLRKSLLAAACATLFAGQASAVHINESFDGAWVDLSTIGTNKGLMVDYIPSVGVFFFAFFTYDEEGNQIWLSNNFVVQDGVRDYADLDAFVFTGGAFSAAGTPASQSVGSIDMSIQCDGIALDFNPAEGSGLNAASFDFVPSLGLDSLTSGECSAPRAECPAGTTAQGNDCVLPNDIAGTLDLPAGKKYIVQGKVTVSEGGVLNIAPGVTVQGSADDSVTNFIAVLPGGRIYANGTAAQPVTFTGPQPVAGSWAGLVLAGRSSCNAAAGDLACVFEADPTITFGGDQLDDSSGALRYTRILYAGQEIAPDEELNALTLLGVGSGTVLDHVQVDNGLDDGFEWFGGTVNGRYLVCSNMTDDCFDTSLGYSGKVQFALAYQGVPDSFTGDPHGIESDNNEDAFDASPRTVPMIANLTLAGSADGAGGEAVRIRRGSGAIYANIVATGYGDRCLNLNDDETFALASAAAQGELLNIQYSFFGGCAGGTFEESEGDAYSVGAFFNAGAGNTTGDPMLRDGGFLPMAGSPVLSGGQSPADPFFVPASYRGAFAGPNDNWTAGWTVNLPIQ